MVLRLKAWESRSSPGFLSSKNSSSSKPSSQCHTSRNDSTGTKPKAIVPGKRASAGWSSPVARQAHNLKVAGSNPAPATTFTERRNPSGTAVSPEAAFLVSGLSASETILAISPTSSTVNPSSRGYMMTRSIGLPPRLVPFVSLDHVRYLASDDLPVAPRERRADRRGLAVWSAARAVCSQAHCAA
jgi:hypothetical protein